MRVWPRPGEVICDSCGLALTDATSEANKDRYPLRTTVLTGASSERFAIRLNIENSAAAVIAMYRHWAQSILDEEPRHDYFHT